jgi:hypothetical protein
MEQDVIDMPATLPYPGELIIFRRLFSSINHLITTRGGVQ